MAQKLDLVGQTINGFLVIREDIEMTNKVKHAYWICQCLICKKEMSIYAWLLKQRKIPYCKECKRDLKLNQIPKGPPEDLTGRVFGELKVLGPTDMRKHNHVVWRTICSCGKEVFVYTDLLKRERVIPASCGHIEIQTQLQTKNLIGKKFGHLNVIAYTGRYKQMPSGAKLTIWVCQCECGGIKEVHRELLTSGKTLSCGNCQNKSFGVVQVRRYLEENTIPFETEYWFDDCKNERHLLFDFCGFIDNQPYLIEYNGEQHYKKSPKFDSKKENVALRQHRDQIKVDYCQKNNIPLLVIPYWDKFRIPGLLDEFLSNKIKEVV